MDKLLMNRRLMECNRNTTNVKAYSKQHAKTLMENLMMVKLILKSVYYLMSLLRKTNFTLDETEVNESYLNYFQTQ